MKKLIYTAAFALVFVSSVPTALAKGIMGDTKAPHLVHSNAHSGNTRVLTATHPFELHVQGSDLSQLSVDIPDGIKVSDRIVVTDETGKNFDTTVSENDRGFTLAFAQTVPNRTTISVSMKGVNTLAPGYSNIWLYRDLRQKCRNNSGQNIQNSQILLRPSVTCKVWEP